MSMAQAALSHWRGRYAAQFRQVSTARQDVDWNNEMQSAIATGLCIVGLVVGLFLAWSFMAPLTGAVVVPGNVIVKGHGQRVQYPYRGLVSEILVTEGAQVSRGQPLLRFDKTVARADWQEQRSAFVLSALEKARLGAELAGDSNFVIPDDIVDIADHPDVQGAIVTQLDLLQVRQQSHTREIDAVRQKVAELRAREEGLVAQRNSKESQLALMTDEVESLRPLFEAGYVTLSRFRALQRRREALQGDLRGVEASIEEIRQKVETNRRELESMESSWRRDVTTRFNEVSVMLAAQRETLQEAREALNRSTVRAPVAGIVQELKINSIGQVIAPGDSLMTVIPNNQSIVLEGGVHSTDVQDVRKGMPVRVDLIGMPAYGRSVVRGSVAMVSPDVTTAGRNAGKFVVRVDVSSAKAMQLMQPGMPVRMYIETGERSFVSYIFSPILDVIRQSLRES